MCKTGTMTSFGLFYKKMLKIQSPRVQCCLCAFSVMSAVLGMFMLSAGVCLMLNYNFLDVDTSGLPSNLHNEEGKKVVGIILICLGAFSVILSGVVSVLYFTTCGRQTHHTSVGPDAKQQDSSFRSSGDSDRGVQGRPTSRESQGQVSLRHHPHHHRHLGNGSTPGRGSPSLNNVSGSGSRRAGSIPHARSGSDPLILNRTLVTLGKDGPSFSRGGMKPRSIASPSPSSSSSSSTRAASSRSHRRVKKGRHSQGRYKNPLAPHPEEAGSESQSLNESRKSASSRRLQGQVNHGADLEEDLEMTRGSLASGGSSQSTVSHSVIIKVDSSQTTNETSPSHRHSHHGERETTFISEFGETVDSDVNKSNRNRTDDNDDYDDDDFENGDEIGSGRMSRSTVDSEDLSDGLTDGSQAAKKNLDNQIQELIS